MVDKELLEILCCPETKQDIAMVDKEIINTINRLIAEKKITNRGGDMVEEPIDGGLLRQDRKYLYPIREDIPIMLIDEAIPFDQVEQA